MKKIQARIFMVLMALIMALSTSTVALAAQKQLSDEPTSETSPQAAQKILVMIIETVCPLPFGWPVI